MYGNNRIEAIRLKISLTHLKQINLLQQNLLSCQIVLAVAPGIN